MGRITWQNICLHMIGNLGFGKNQNKRQNCIVSEFVLLSVSDNSGSDPNGKNKAAVG